MTTTVIIRSDSAGMPGLWPFAGDPACVEEVAVSSDESLSKVVKVATKAFLKTFTDELVRAEILDDAPEVGQSETEKKDTE